MGLKNKQTQFDLVQGNSPVEEMDYQSGPQFQLPIDEASQIHINSLKDLPITSPHQDLDGLPDYLFNTLNGTSDSPFQSHLGDHLKSLLTKNAKSTNTGMVYEPGTQDLNGNQGPQFQLPTDQASQKHINSLTQQSTYQHGNSTATVGPSTQDMDGSNGPSFMNTNQIQTQLTSLEEIYQSTINPGASYGAGQPGSTYPKINPSNLDINGQKGPEFDTGKPSQVHADPNQKTPTELVADYTSKVNPGANYGNSQWPVVPAVTQDLNGNAGPKFDKGALDRIHGYPQNLSKPPTELVANYTSTVNPSSNYGNSNWPVVPAVNQDLDGVNGPSFNGNGQTLHKDLLANIYQSSVNPGASYGAGQSGGTWPSVKPGTHDLNGGLPSTGQYINNLPK